MLFPKILHIKKKSLRTLIWLVRNVTTPLVGFQKISLPKRFRGQFQKISGNRGCKNSEITNWRRTLHVKTDCWEPGRARGEEEFCGLLSFVIGPNDYPASHGQTSEKQFIFQTKRFTGAIYDGTIHGTTVTFDVSKIYGNKLSEFCFPRRVSTLDR